MRVRYFPLTAIVIGLVFGLPTLASAPPVPTNVRISQAGSEFPADAATVAFAAIQSAKTDGIATPAFLLSGSAGVWRDGFNLEKVDSTGGATAPGPALSRVPVNLDFEDSETSQSVAWAPRTLHNFGVPVASDTGGVGHDAQLSCDELAEELRLLLLQLGARAADLHIDQRDCPRDERQLRLIDATFSVLVPVGATGKNVSGTLAAHWQPVELKTGTAHKEFRSSRVPSWTFSRDCSYLQYVAQTVLPLFSGRNINETSQAACKKTDVGFSAEVLMPTQQLGSSQEQ